MSSFILNFNLWLHLFSLFYDELKKIYETKIFLRKITRDVKFNCFYDFFGSQFYTEAVRLITSQTRSFVLKTVYTFICICFMDTFYLIFTIKIDTGKCAIGCQTKTDFKYAICFLQTPMSKMTPVSTFFNNWYYVLA